jgi:hypothetical protein
MRFCVCSGDITRSDRKQKNPPNLSGAAGKPFCENYHNLYFNLPPQRVLIGNIFTKLRKILLIAFSIYRQAASGVARKTWLLLRFLEDHSLKGTNNPDLSFQYTSEGNTVKVFFS